MDKQQLKFFVGGLPYNVKRDEIYQYFSRFGKLERVTFLKKEKGSMALGYCFLKFSEVSQFSLGSIPKDLIFKNRNIEIHPMVRRTQLKNLMKLKYNRKIFLNNIPITFTPATLTTLFDQFGDVDKCFIIERMSHHNKYLKNQNTNKRLGNYGYVSFKDSSGASAACNARIVFSESGDKIEIYKYNPKNLHGEYDISKRMLPTSIEEIKIVKQNKNTSINDNFELSHFLTPTRRKYYQSNKTGITMQNLESNIQFRILRHTTVKKPPLALVNI